MIKTIKNNVKKLFVGVLAFAMLAGIFGFVRPVKTAEAGYCAPEFGTYTTYANLFPGNSNADAMGDLSIKFDSLTECDFEFIIDAVDPIESGDKILTFGVRFQGVYNVVSIDPAEDWAGFFNPSGISNVISGSPFLFVATMCISPALSFYTHHDSKQCSLAAYSSPYASGTQYEFLAGYGYLMTVNVVTQNAKKFTGYYIIDVPGEMRQGDEHQYMHVIDFYREDNGALFNFTIDNVVAASSFMKYRPYWELKRFDIVYDGMDVIDEADALTEYQTVTAPEIEGMTFSGYFLDGGFDVEYVEGTPLTDNMTLYPKYVTASVPGDDPGDDPGELPPGGNEEPGTGEEPAPPVPVVVVTGWDNFINHMQNNWNWYTLGGIGFLVVALIGKWLIER